MRKMAAILLLAATMFSLLLLVLLLTSCSSFTRDVYRNRNAVTQAIPSKYGRAVYEGVLGH